MLPWAWALLGLVVLGLDECWEADFNEDVCCQPPQGNPACFPQDLVFTYELCCSEVIEMQRQLELAEAQQEAQRAMAEQYVRAHEEELMSRPVAVQACEELHAALWKVVDGGHVTQSEVDVWLFRSRHACPIGAFTVRLASLLHDAERLQQFGDALHEKRASEHHLPEGTLWMWDLMMTDMRWTALLDQREWPIFQIISKVGAALQELWAERSTARADPRVDSFRRAHDSGELIPVIEALIVLNMEPWCSHLSLAAYVAVAEHMDPKDQPLYVHRVEECFREQNLQGTFGKSIMMNSPLWPLLARLSCSRGFCKPE